MEDMAFEDTPTKYKSQVCIYFNNTGFFFFLLKSNILLIAKWYLGKNELSI